MFSLLATNEYGVSFMSSDLGYRKNPTFASCFAMHESSLGPQLPKFENLTKQQCVETYAEDFVMDRRNLILVSNNSTIANESLLWVGTEVHQRPFSCLYQKRMAGCALMAHARRKPHKSSLKVHLGKRTVGHHLR